jgi:hypothetical protein
MTEVSKHTTLGPYVDISILIDEAGAEGVLGGPLDRSIKKALESLGDPKDPDGKIAAALAASNPYHYNLGFFYISDLIDTVLGILNQN